MARHPDPNTLRLLLHRQVVTEICRSNSNASCKVVNERVRDKSEDLTATSVKSPNVEANEAIKDATAIRDVEVTRDREGGNE
jgi:hypothetical protein